LSLKLAVEVRRRLEELGVSRDAATILSYIFERGRLRVGVTELLAMFEGEGKGEEELREALLELEGLRALLPARSRMGRGLAWEHRVVSLRADDELEVPPSIYYALEGLASTGRWSYEYAAQRYFEAIREPLADEFVEAVKRVASRSKRVVDAEEIKEALVEAGAPPDRVGVFISELKGGGFISPLLSRAQWFERGARAPLYELNPLLFMLKR